jgi:hypothetical protein
LLINVACVGMPTWRNRKKTWCLGLACNLWGKAKSNHLIWGVMWWEWRWRVGENGAKA